jgi:hypothetical protein
MSLAQSPLMGPMRKSMGNFTVYSYQGMNIVRSKPFHPSDPKSDKQLNMRARMSGIAGVYQTFKSIIALGFPEREVNTNPQNMFVSANFTSAFVLADKTPVISYPLLLLANGSLPRVTIPQATANAGGITMHYDAGALLPDVTAGDEIIACAALTTGELLITRQFIGHELLGTLQLKYPTLQAEQVECCYAFVRSGDGEKASDSVYVEVKE